MGLRKAPPNTPPSMRFEGFRILYFAPNFALHVSAFTVSSAFTILLCLFFLGIN